MNKYLTRYFVYSILLLPQVSLWVQYLNEPRFVSHSCFSLPQEFVGGRSCLREALEAVSIMIS